MGDEGVTPGFAAVLRGVGAGVGAPFDRGIALGEDDRVVHLFASFRLEHVDRISGLGNDVGLVLRIVGAMPVVNLELPLGGLEPFQGITLQDDGEAPLRVRPELLHRVETLGESAEEVLRHVGPMGG